MGPRAARAATVPRMEKDEDFAAMFAEYEQANKGKRRVPTPQAGDRVRGKVTSIGSGTVFVELDGKQGEGMLDVVDVRDADGKLTVAVGDSIEATVIEGGQGQALVLRRGMARGPDARADLARAGPFPAPGTAPPAEKRAAIAS